MADIIALRDAIMKAKADLKGMDEIFNDDGEEEEEEKKIDPYVASSTQRHNSQSSRSAEEMLHREAMAAELAAKNKARSDEIKQKKMMEREERIALQRRQREQKQREEESIKSGNSMLGIDSSSSSRKLEVKTKPIASSSSSSSSGELSGEVPVVTRWQSGAVVSGTTTNTNTPSSSSASTDFASTSEGHDDTVKIPYKNPTDGVKLQVMLEYLEDTMGWEGTHKYPSQYLPHFHTHMLVIYPQKLWEGRIGIGLDQTFYVRTILTHPLHQPYNTHTHLKTHACQQLHIVD